VSGTTVAVTSTCNPPVLLAPSRATLGEVIDGSGTVQHEMQGSSHPLDDAASAAFQGQDIASVPLGAFVAAKVATTPSLGA
jgi:hypothetical protein